MTDKGKCPREDDFRFWDSFDFPDAQTDTSKVGKKVSASSTNQTSGFCGVTTATGLSTGNNARPESHMLDPYSPDYMALQSRLGYEQLPEKQSTPLYKNPRHPSNDLKQKGTKSLSASFRSLIPDTSAALASLPSMQMPVVSLPSVPVPSAFSSFSSLIPSFQTSSQSTQKSGHAPSSSYHQDSYVFNSNGNNRFLNNSSNDVSAQVPLRSASSDYPDSYSRCRGGGNHGTKIASAYPEQASFLNTTRAAVTKIVQGVASGISNSSSFKAGTPQDYFRRDSKATDGNWDNVAVDSEVNKKSPWSKANDSWGGFADDEDHARREEKRGLLANGRE